MRKYETTRATRNHPKGSQCWAVSTEAAAAAFNFDMRSWQKPITADDLVDITPEDDEQEND